MQILFGTLVALATVVALVLYGSIVNAILSQGENFVNHVFLFWGWSKFIHEVTPASFIYVPHVLYVFQLGLPGASHTHLPFAYPPSLLLLIWPLGLLGPVTAWAVWGGIGLGVYSWATWHRPWGVRLAALGLVAPSTVGAIFAAQTSLLAAALMIGGCRLLDRRPVLAGLLFGLLAAVKPQYGLLVPVALVAARQWRSIAAAAATVALAVLVSAWVFGWSAWIKLPGALEGLSALVARHPRFDLLSPTVTAGLRMLGAGPVLTDGVQLVSASAAAVAVWICFRRGVTPLGTAALMAGAFLVTPYALYYDLPVVTYAVLVVVLERHRSHQRFKAAEVAVLAVATALPMLMWMPFMLLRHPLAGWGSIPWGVIVLAALFGVIVRRCLILARPRGAPPGTAPV